MKKLFSQHPSASALLQVLGIGFGIAVTVGATVSGGILRSPAQVAAQLPETWMFLGIWVVGALYAFVCAVSFAELGTMMPRSGGLYIFAQRAMGDYAGFMVGWVDWITSCGTVSASALLIGDVTAGIVPALQGKSTLIATVIVLVFTVFLWLGVRASSLVQSTTSALKAFALLIVAVAAFLLGGNAHKSISIQSSFPGQAFMVAPPISPTIVHGVVPIVTTETHVGLSFIAAIILALQIVIYLYDGYYGVIYFGEEVRNPARDIPRSMLTSVAIAGVIYLLLNAAFIYVMPLQRIASSDFIGGAVAKLTFGASGDVVVRSLIIICELSTINAFFLFATRTMFGMSRDGFFSPKAIGVSSKGTPTVSLILSMLVALAFLLSGTFEKALAILTFAIVTNYGIAFLSVFILRRREPNTERLYKAWGYPWTTGIALVGSVVFLIGSAISDPEHTVYGVLALLASYPMYSLSKRYLL
jgi:basic amino acid/polyamine antiporter, APA family